MVAVAVALMQQACQLQGQMQATMVDTIEHLLQREFSLTKQWQSPTNSYWNTDSGHKAAKNRPR